MRHFQLIHAGLDVGHLLGELASHPALWNEHRERKEAPGTPHGDMADIWVRFFPRETLRRPDDFAQPGTCVFYPAWRALPSLQPIIWSLMATLKATELGGILITRLPPGGRILPHTDPGWHATHYNIKAHITLQANARCIVRVLDEEMVFRPGEVWLYPNDVEHEVQNLGSTDRIVVIVALRVEA